MYMYLCVTVFLSPCCPVLYICTVRSCAWTRESTPSVEYSISFSSQETLRKPNKSFWNHMEKSGRYTLILYIMVASAYSVSEDVSEGGVESPLGECCGGCVF